MPASRLADDLHIDLVEVPLPLAEALHPAHPLVTNICSKHRAAPVSPMPHGIVADVDPALRLQVFPCRPHFTRGEIALTGPVRSLGIMCAGRRAYALRQSQQLCPSQACQERFGAFGDTLLFIGRELFIGADHLRHTRVGGDLVAMPIDEIPI